MEDKIFALDVQILIIKDNWGCLSQKMVHIEISDFWAQACNVFIHDEDDTQTGLEHTFGVFYNSLILHSIFEFENTTYLGRSVIMETSTSIG